MWARRGDDRAAEHGADRSRRPLGDLQDRVGVRQLIIVDEVGKAGEDGGGLVVVTDGLSAGERVVTSNQYRLQPGARVRVLAAESAAEPSKIAQRSAP